MSNNPGKKGKPAPWIKAENAYRDRALDEYRRANHAAYDQWRAARTEASIRFHKEAEAKHPGLVGISDAMKASGKKLKKWDQENPSPMSWEEHKRLEAEFNAQ